jgi:2-oxo-4-hydroxy-4-carboxy-5-ureidoimidazoline decarboxylase
VTRGEFLIRFGPVFENRPDLAAAAWDLGPVDVAGGAAGLHRAFAAVLRSLPPDALLAFLNGHPDLAGRAARPADLTPDSLREQGSAGLDGLDAAGNSKLLDMNQAYRARFGFPFIMAVKDKAPAEILAALEARLHNSAAEERSQALREVDRILLLRLKDRLGEA